MNWMIAANGQIYDHASSFEKHGFIDWRKMANYQKGDSVYIYCTRPLMRVMYETIVEIEEMSIESIVDDREYWYKMEEYEKALGGKYVRLKLVKQADNEHLSLMALKQIGLKAAPQGPKRIDDALAKYISTNLNDYGNHEIFPDVTLDESAWEGSRIEVSVNRYERSSIARRKCIECKGTTCIVCNMNFEERYGEVGAGFIHIHHLTPLHEINEKYAIDYKEDLVPVCPNCHAMLHRSVAGKALSIQELHEQFKIRNP